MMIINEPASPAPEITSIASIVHDMRNPLTAIHGSAELLMAAGLSAVQINRIARNLYGASVRMKELVDDFLCTHGGPHLVAKVCDMSKVVAAAVDKIAMLAEFQLVQIVQQVPDNLRVTMDPRRIQGVFVNLFVNALDVMPNGGTIRVSAGIEGGSVLVKVCDSGPGIAPEIHGDLFQPFATAGKANGLGLGLAFSRRTVADFGGEIWVESSRRGACFAISFPAATRQFNASDRHSPRKNGANRGSA